MPSSANPDPTQDFDTDDGLTRDPRIAIREATGARLLDPLPPEWDDREFGHPLLVVPVAIHEYSGSKGAALRCLRLLSFGIRTLIYSRETHNNRRMVHFADGIDTAAQISEREPQ